MGIRAWVVNMSEQGQTMSDEIRTTLAGVVAGLAELKDTVGALTTEFAVVNARRDERGEIEKFRAVRLDATEKLARDNQRQLDGMKVKVALFSAVFGTAVAAVVSLLFKSAGA